MKQGVALTGCNTTGPPCSAGPSGRTHARPPARRPSTRQAAGRPDRRQRYRRRRQTPASTTILAH